MSHSAGARRRPCDLPPKQMGIGKAGGPRAPSAPSLPHCSLPCRCIFAQVHERVVSIVADIKGVREDFVKASAWSQAASGAATAAADRPGGGDLLVRREAPAGAAAEGGGAGAGAEWHLAAGTPAKVGQNGRC
eukprot:235631-Chlamydomonas_euryale.AAC.6